MKKIAGGQTVVYVNQYYEVNLTTNHLYYPISLYGPDLGSKLIARLEKNQSQNETLHYIHQYHLTSTSLIADETGSHLCRSKSCPITQAYQ